MEKKNTIPWVEKYRPTEFDNIVLDPLNRELFKNILVSSCYSMIYRIHGKKTYSESRDIFLDNIPKYENLELFDYKTFFLYSHIIYILFLIILCWIISLFAKNIYSIIIFILLIYLSYW
jgi:hypothetical protein